MIIRWQRAAIITAIAAIVLGWLLVPSCSRTTSVCNDGESTESPVDPTLLAFLSRARAAHHMADLREDDDAAGAIAALSAVVDGPIPDHKGVTPAEAREVLADTQARLADLESRLFRFDSALRRIGLALGWVPDIGYFRGHLFETRGLVEQRYAEQLAKSEHPAESAAAKARALAAFETAMQIQAEVIRQTPSNPRRTPRDPQGQSNHSSSPAPSEPLPTQGPPR